MCVHTNKHVTASGDLESKTKVSAWQFFVLVALVENCLLPLAPGSPACHCYLSPFIPDDPAMSSGLPGKPESSLHFGSPNLLRSSSSPRVNYHVWLLILEGGDTDISGVISTPTSDLHDSFGSSACPVSHKGLPTLDGVISPVQSGLSSTSCCPLLPLISRDRRILVIYCSQKVSPVPPGPTVHL